MNSRSLYGMALCVRSPAKYERRLRAMFGHLINIYNLEEHPLRQIDNRAGLLRVRAGNLNRKGATMVFKCIVPKDNAHHKSSNA